MKNVQEHHGLAFTEATPERKLVGACVDDGGLAWQGEYCLRYGAVGTRVALVASEPITRQAGDWVAVPRNTALIIISEKVGSRFRVLAFMPSIHTLLPDRRSWDAVRCIVPLSLMHQDTGQGIERQASVS